MLGRRPWGAVSGSVRAGCAALRGSGDLWRRWAHHRRVGRYLGAAGRDVRSGLRRVVAASAGRTGLRRRRRRAAQAHAARSRAARRAAGRASSRRHESGNATSSRWTLACRRPHLNTFF